MFRNKKSYQEIVCASFIYIVIITAIASIGTGLMRTYSEFDV